MLGGTVRGKRTTLRTTTEADLADHLRWHADASLTEWMTRRPRPQTLDQRKEWLKETAKDSGTVHWEINEGEAHVGYCAATFVWPPLARGWWINDLFLEPGAQARGLAVDAARALHRYLIDYLDLEQGDVWLYRDDAGARAVFEALGYREYAHGHDVFYRSGRWWDDWRGCLTADEFRTRFPDEVEYPEREES